MTRLAKVPLCPTCRLDAGWLYEDDGSFSRCDHGAVQAAVTAAEERDRALAGVADGNRAAMKAALAIIRDTALTMPVFSSNDTRPRMKIAQIPSETVGAAFRQAAKDHVIRGDSYIPSTDPGTHGHPVRTWSSLIYTGRRTA